MIDCVHRLNITLIDTNNDAYIDEQEKHNTSMNHLTGKILLSKRYFTTVFVYIPLYFSTAQYSSRYN